MPTEGAKPNAERSRMRANITRPSAQRIQRMDYVIVFVVYTLMQVIFMNLVITGLFALAFPRRQ